MGCDSKKVSERRGDECGELLLRKEFWVLSAYLWKDWDRVQTEQRRLVLVHAIL